MQFIAKPSIDTIPDKKKGENKEKNVQQKTYITHFQKQKGSRKKTIS